jgi:hypothetical protein
MTSLAGELSVVVGLLVLSVFVVFSSLRINRNRKERTRSRRITDRLLNWK